MKFLKSFLLFMLLFGGRVDFLFAQCTLDYSNYNLVLNENFDSIKNINELKSRWQLTPDDRYWGWGGSDGEYYEESQVELLKGGFLRLKCDRLPSPESFPIVNGTETRTPIYKSGMIQTKWGMNGYPYDDGCWDTPVGGSRGFAMGMFEIKMKIPKGCTYPAFWLYSAPTQINIFEGKFNSRKFGVGYDNEALLGHPGQNNWFTKMNWDDLADTFHTYTSVWTPTQISFYYDGKELATYNDTALLNHLNNTCPAPVIMSLQMKNWCGIQDAHMDIDFIKVYKPKNNDYTVSYSTGICSKINLPRDEWYEIIKDGTSGVYDSTATIHVVPNPASDFISLQSLFAFNGAIYVSVYDICGKMILTQTITKAKLTIDVSSLSNGVYVVKMYNGKKNFHGKFVKI